MSKPKAVVLSVTIECPTEGVGSVDIADVSYSSSYSGCELCGSHGETEMVVLCPCGNYHDIVITSS